MARLSRVALIADHDSANRYLASRMLRHAHLVAIEARSGRGAVEQARHFRPDIIILEMNMPDQSGLTTLQQLRADSCTAAIPVIFLATTAHSAFEHKKGEELGASAYLFSTVQPDRLVAVVEGSIHRATDLEGY